LRNGGGFGRFLPWHAAHVNWKSPISDFGQARGSAQSVRSNKSSLVAQRLPTLGFGRNTRKPEIGIEFLPSGDAVSPKSLAEITFPPAACILISAGIKRQQFRRSCSRRKPAVASTPECPEGTSAGRGRKGAGTCFPTCANIAKNCVLIRGNFCRKPLGGGPWARLRIRCVTEHRVGKAIRPAEQLGAPDARVVVAAHGAAAEMRNRCCAWPFAGFKDAVEFLANPENLTPPATVYVV
jgi:hypothetical protein